MINTATKGAFGLSAAGIGHLMSTLPIAMAPLWVVDATTILAALIALATLISLICDIARKIRDWNTKRNKGE